MHTAKWKYRTRQEAGKLEHDVVTIMMQLAGDMHVRVAGNLIFLMSKI